MVASADVADRRQMDAVVKDAERRFGALHGVVHAAGRPGAGLIALTSPEAMRAVLTPKVEGALVLDELFHDRPLDFMLLCSSLTGVRGAVGQADYAAGNAFLDVLAQKATVERPERLTIAIAWDTWRESGMAVDAELPAALAARREELLRFGLTDAEGARVFRRALDLGLSRILVSTRPLAGRWTEAGPTPGKPPVAAAAPAASVVPSLPRHPRPVLQNDYVGPRNDVERGLADAWQRVLGIDRVGVTDNFFELGGESLSALRLVALLEQTQQIRLSLVGLYETPTIEGLAAASAVSAAPVEAVLETSGRRGETRAEALAMRRQGRRGAADGGIPRGDAD
jgi:NAD(P)-dependent dehydrogenase (short-subunit alcohol dehydrogenase family)/acyl carrier protein